MNFTSSLLTLFLTYFVLTCQVYGQERPNIVLIFPDNLGFGEVSSFGSARGIGCLPLLWKVRELVFWEE